mmetsp:Transcript_24810/g.38653  ORF Transcript_24810/g.38653 Transcript_24810/m.38653 type:complete len:176 (-) Transcript_24810:54-581(-)
MSAIIGLKEGEDIPQLKVKDIFGVEVNTNPSGNDGIQMVSFAGKDSSERLTFLDDMAVTLSKEFPGKEASSLAVADVAGIPYLIQFPVQALLKSSTESAAEKSKKFFQEQGVEPFFKKHNMLPDWEGTICKGFKVSGTEKFILIVVNKGKIVAIFIESDDTAEKLLECFRGLLKE